MARQSKKTTEDKPGEDFGVLNLTLPNDQKDSYNISKDLSTDPKELASGSLNARGLGDSKDVADQSVYAVQTTKYSTVDAGGLKFWHKDGGDVPQYGTQGSAAFDLKANLKVGEHVKLYQHNNQPKEKTVRGTDESLGRLYVDPGERVLVPTGLHADIPNGYWLAIFPRSGTSWKQGLILTNSVAVIDNDYVEEIFISLTNISGSRVVIEDGDRIAQGMLQSSVSGGRIKALSEKPKQKTDRAGGFGSTGSK